MFDNIFALSSNLTAISSISNVSSVSSEGELIEGMVDNIFKNDYDRNTKLSFLNKLLTYMEDNYEFAKHAVEQYQRNDKACLSHETSEFMKTLGKNEFTLMGKEYIKYTIDRKDKGLLQNKGTPKEKKTLLDLIDKSKVDFIIVNKKSSDAGFNRINENLSSYIVNIDVQDWSKASIELFQRLYRGSPSYNEKEKKISFQIDRTEMQFNDQFQHVFLTVFGQKMAIKEKNMTHQQLNMKRGGDWIEHIKKNKNFDVKEAQQTIRTRRYKGDSGGPVNRIARHNFILPSVRDYSASKMSEENEKRLKGNLTITHRYPNHNGKELKEEKLKEEKFSLVYTKSNKNKVTENSKRNLVILFPGNGNISTDFKNLVEQYNRKGIDVVMLDYPGVLGKGEPAVNLDHAVVRGIAVYESMRGLGYSPDNIVLNGFSIGGNIATKVCHETGKANSTYSRLITTCSPQSMSSVIGGKWTENALSKENNSDVLEDYKGIPKENKIALHVQDNPFNPDCNDTVVPPKSTIGGKLSTQDKKAGNIVAINNDSNTQGHQAIFTNSATVTTKENGESKNINLLDYMILYSKDKDLYKKTTNAPETFLKNKSNDYAQIMAEFRKNNRSSYQKKQTYTIPTIDECSTLTVEDQKLPTIDKRSTLTVEDQEFILGYIERLQQELAQKYKMYSGRKHAKIQGLISILSNCNKGIPVQAAIQTATRQNPHMLDGGKWVGSARTRKLIEKLEQSYPDTDSTLSSTLTI